MAAQAKPSTTCDSLPTAIGSGGSLCAGSNSDLTPASAASPDGAALPHLPLGLYVHVPFCASTCDFCAFYQEKPRRQSIDLYLDAVAAELRQVSAEVQRGAGWLWQGEVGAAAVGAGNGVPSPACAPEAGAAGAGFTIFFGGGTPGLLSAKDLDRLCGLVRSALEGLGPIREWSIELAPSTVKADKVKVLLEHGVTRFSLGVQSFSEPLLDALGRQHSPKQALAAYQILRENGATNINCDLMFALPGQTREAWLDDLEKMRALGPEHISTYCLTFEEDTALWVKLSQGRYKLDPEHEAALYRETWAWLAAAGYAQYEVSNFAREGFRSGHNLATWQMSRWRGIGPSAASQWGGWRFQNPADIEKWARAVLGSADCGAIGSGSSGSGGSGPCAGGSDGAAADVAGSPAVSGGAVYSGSGAQQTAGPVSGCAPAAVWPPVQTEQHVQLTNRLLAADALIFGLRRREGVSRSGWLRRFVPEVQSVSLAATAVAAPSVVTDSETVAIAAVAADAHAVEALPLDALMRLFARLEREEMLTVDSGCWRLTDEGLLLADAIGGEILECFE